MRFLPIQLRLKNAAGHKMDSLWAKSPLTTQKLPIFISLPAIGNEYRTPELYWTSAGWELSNASPNLCVFINDKTLLPNKSAPVLAGDMLEVGLCRFLVEAVEDAQSSATNLGDELARAHAPDNGRASAVSHAQTIQSTQAQNLAEDGLTPQENNVFDLVSAGPEDEWFERYEPTPQAPAAQTRGDSVLEAQTPFCALPEMNESEESFREIAFLHREYLRALSDPYAPPVLKLARSERKFVPSVPTLLKDNENQTTEEIVLARPSMDALVEQFGHPEPADPFVLEAHEDILRLFAPEQMRSPEKNRLPPRSRQDHHAIGLDSHYYVSSDAHSANKTQAASAKAPEIAEMAKPERLLDAFTTKKGGQS